MKLMRVSELADVCRSIQPVRESTYANWQKALKPLQHLEIADVNKAVALQYRSRLLQPNGPLKQNTLKQRIATLRGLWNKAIDFELISGDNPWNKTDRGLKYLRRNPELYPWEHYSRYHDDPYFVFLWYTGARIQEIAGLYPENIVMDTEIPYFNFVHQENRMLKNDDSIRKMPIHPACYRLIPNFRMSKAKDPGRSWSETFKKNMNLPLGDAAHTLRHSFTSRCNEAGILERVQDAFVGHAPRSMTARYGRVTLSLLSRELQKLQ